MADHVPGPVRLGRPAASAGGDSATLKRLVRALLGLHDDQTVVIQQLTCAEPGCPPVETVVAVLSPSDPIRRWKIHKPLSDIVGDDLRAALTEGEQQ